MPRRDPHSMNHTAPSLTPPSSQEATMTDTRMSEAPFMQPASITDHQTAAATADRIDHAQQRPPPPPPPPQQQYPTPEQAPPMTDTPPAGTFPREHPPREPPTPRRPTPRLYDNNIFPDRKPPLLSSYPTAPDSLPQTPRAGMSAPRTSPYTGTPTADRIPRLSSYPTAPASAPQTPKTGTTAQMPQQGGLPTAGWLVSPTANPGSRITFEGTF